MCFWLAATAAALLRQLASSLSRPLIKPAPTARLRRMPPRRYIIKEKVRYRFIEDGLHGLEVEEKAIL